MAAKVSGEVKVVYSAEDKATPVGRQVQRGLRETGRTSDSVAEQMKKQWTAVATVFKVAVAAAVTAMAKEVIKSFSQMVNAHVQTANSLDKFVKQTGMAVEQLQRLKYAAEQEYLPFENLSKLFPIIAQRGMLAAQGNETYARSFRALGVDVVDSKGKLRDTYDMLMDMSDYMSNESIPAHEKLAQARDLLGRSGADIIPFLKQGREAIEALGVEAERVGGIISAESIAITKAWDNQGTKAQIALQGIKSAFATDLLPYLYKFREWVIDNLPMLQRYLANVGAGVGKMVIVVMQYGMALRNFFDRLKVAFGLMLEMVAIANRKIWQGLNYMSLGMSSLYKNMRDNAEQYRKQGIQMQMDGLSAMQESAAEIVALDKILKNIDKTRAEMIKSAAFSMHEASKGEVSKTKDTENKKTTIIDNSAQERLRIYEWLADKQMQIDYEGYELVRRQTIKEYTDRAKALKMLEDYTGEMQVLVTLTAELAKLDSAEEARRRAEAEKEEAKRLKEEMERRKEEERQLLELLDKEEVAYQEMVRLNEQLRAIRQGIYEDSWKMMMDTANLAGGDLGKFAGMAMAGMKGAWDTELGVDPYSQQMEQLNAFYQQRIEKIQEQAQIERELMIMNNAAELDLIRLHEAEKALIQQAHLDKDVQMTGLQQAQKLDMYQANINLTMGILGMLGSFLDKESQAIFAIEKAAAVASIIVNSQSAAALALKTLPYPLGQALAAKYLLWGKIMAATTAATAIKQMTTGTTAPGSVTTGAGYEYTQPETPKWEPEKTSKTINVYVYGHIVDQDKFARELIPSLDKAFTDGVH